MSASRKCHQCGATVPETACEGLCRQCLADLALNPDAHLGEPGVPGQETGGRGQESGDSPPLATGHSPPGKVGVFADYELLEEIARGGMGVIYKARQRSLNRIVALKMILAGQLASKEQVGRFRTEAQAAANLQHPNIVAIHEVGEADGQHYFSMDYVEGRNLAELLHEGPMVARQAANYLRTIAEAVHCAHQHGIIHRDLKPSNVLIDTNDQPRITDFGLAKRLENTEPGTRNAELTLSGQVLGSPNYLPPEQAEGKRGQVGPPSDVYALGAILYHLLTGRPPFQAESLTTLIRQVLETEPVAPRLLNPSIPRDLETICLKCLEKDMPRRYPSAHELADELGRFLEDKPIQARPVGVPEKVWRWCRRNPRLAALGTTSVLLLLAVAIGSPIAAYRINRERKRAEAEKLFARHNAYAADMSLALRDANSGSLARPQSLLDTYRPKPGEPDLRRWEWRLLWKLCRSDAWFTLSRERTDLATLAVSPNGQTLAARALSGDVSLWDIPTRK